MGDIWPENTPSEEATSRANAALTAWHSGKLDLETLAQTLNDICAH